MHSSTATKEDNYTPVDQQFIQSYVDQAAHEQPDRTAVIFGEHQLTYRQLNERADNLCQAILHNSPETDLVGVSTTRSLEMVIGILAILKAGKAYLPLDPTYPEQRLQQLITDSGVQSCLATTADEPLLTDLSLQVIQSDQAYSYPKQPVTRQNPTACVLYTSGSTGKPKGVCLTHSGLINFLNWQTARWTDQPGLQTLQFCHLSFDASFQELFVPLLTGGTIHLIDDSYRLNAGRLLDYIQQQGISRVFLPYVALQYLAEAAVADVNFPISLLEVITGGELLKITPPIARFFAALPNCTLMNVYGPTEASVWVTEHRLRGNALNWPQLPTIGQPIADLNVFILNEALELVTAGEVGELCISGICLADGYLNQPELTADKFVRWVHPERGERVIYRTGDLARYQPDGTLDFQGRRDYQVKIRGNRVELGEIEVVLAEQPAVQQAVVVAREEVPGQKRLVAYVVAPVAAFAVSALRKALEERLPDFMIPSYFVRLDDLPRTTSGKVDKLQLPTPEYTRPELTTRYQAPKTELEKQLVERWSEWLQMGKIGRDDNFFELGGNSLLAQKTVAALKQYQHSLPITKLYQYPTAAGIARFLEPKSTNQSQQPGSPTTAAQHRQNRKSLSTPNADIAIIGMAGRFPGANTIDELWAVLKQGKETTRFFTDTEIDPSVPARLKNDPSYVKARGVIDQPDQFDALFFGITPNVAQVMDPQQRIFLEIAWEALEQTGYLPNHYSGRVGVFAGCGNNTYYLNNVLPNQALVDQIGAFQVMTVNEKDYIASRTAYQLNLKGPAVSVYSACSTSLLAITQAVQSIRDGQCEVALAGGASITAPVNSGHLYQEGTMLSRDGHTRSFGTNAYGTVFSDGAGVVLLKSVEAAKRDGDTIWAVIKGIGVNNDGGGKGSFTAPNAEGQAGAIRMAIDDAGIDPATITYVEAHGTATPVGDPIEIDGLVMAFGEQTRKQFCAIGSIKSNMGHLTQAAGVAGLIKTTLALHHKQIPASLNFDQPNPAIDFANSPFVVNTKLTDWQVTDWSTPRRAGVSSFGVGGTNVHVVLEESAQDVPLPDTTEPVNRPGQLITWSAKSVTSRDAYAKRLADTLSHENNLNLADIAFTGQTTRPTFTHRRFAVASTPAELIDKLRAEINTPTTKQASDDVVFLFPGQGAQYLNMGRALYDHEAVFRQAIDDCADYLTAQFNLDIRRVLYTDSMDSEAEQLLKNTRYTQPALFVTEYALARLWMSWGIEPSIFCGHSVGEFVAAHLAGVFTLTDALTLIATRGQLVGELPRGSMLSVRLEASKVDAMMPSTLSMAAINSHKLCVVAGPDEHIADFTRLLDDKEIPNRPLATSHAFHSAMMDPIVGEFEKLVAGMSLNRPQKPIVSTVSGSYLTDAQAIDPHYWAVHLRTTVRFADALETLFALDQPLLLEVGPGHTLTTLARQQASGKPVTILTSLGNQPDSQAVYQTMLTSLGQVYLSGLEPDWRAFYADQPRRRIPLPTYAFDRKRCWVEPILAQPIAITSSEFINSSGTSSPEQPTAMSTRKDTLVSTINQLVEDASGIEMNNVQPDTTFLEIGLDSLLLTQMALNFKKEFSLPITFRQLTSEYATPDLLATYLDRALPAEQYQPMPVAAPVAQPAPVHVPAPAPVYAPASAVVTSANDSALGLVAQQLQLLAKQIALLQGNSQVVAPAIEAPVPAAPTPLATNGKPKVSLTVVSPDITPEEAVELKKPFGATPRIERQVSELSGHQRSFLQQLTQRYNQKTGRSKAYAQEHRPHMADPRVVSGFRPLTKEIIYPLVMNRSKGSRMWDIDGNEYIDILNGFGSNMFGYQPDLIKQALHEQVENGYEVGPQHELAGEVAQLVCELTGADRAALCSTGSEAVLGAMRVARTVTGRSLIVAFTGSYHGIVDEVLVRGTKKLKSFPAAPGIMPESVQNMLILDYGTDESLKIIRERASELAAVLVEPVQSRRPEFVPIDFLKEVRAITAESGTALIFDEIITGFRMHPGGTQALFGIRADLASYGKVVGAGMPIGVIAGKRAFMDALDGGFWQYGDNSGPEVGVTYFAGTFVRHPLALAAAKASMLYMKEKGPQLQQSITQKAKRLADSLNAAFTQRQLPLFVAQFGSLWKIKFNQDVPYAELLFTLMREKGIHVWDGFPCFMTEAITDAEIDTVIFHFIESADELIEAGFFNPILISSTKTDPVGVTFAGNTPPAPGARLGRDQQGNPAWFIPNPDQPGKYLQVDLN